jgi:hypothetical protein
MLPQHEGQEADSQTDTGCVVSDLWFAAKAEVRTQHGAAPCTPASGSAPNLLGTDGSFQPQSVSVIAMLRQLRNPLVLRKLVTLVCGILADHER